MLTRLKKLGYRVHFAHIQRESGDEKLMRSRWGDHYHPIAYCRKQPPLSVKITRKIAAMFDPGMAHVRNIDEWYDPGVEEELAKLHTQYKFDVVIVEYVFFSKVLECFGGDVIKVIDAHDVFTDRHKLYMENGQRPPWFSTSRRQESKGLNRADIIIAIQKSERDKISRMCKRPVITIGHSVKLSPPKYGKSTCSMLYIGSRNSINSQSINRFINEVMPGIHMRVPEARLIIAGDICDDVSGSKNYITKLGRVAELRELYDTVDIVVNPMLYGTGLKIKNVEALGYSKPLITTSAGAEGLEVGEGTAFLVANSPVEWCDMAVNLLQDDNYRFSLEKNAAEFAGKWNKQISENLSLAMEYSHLEEI